MLHGGCHCGNVELWFETRVAPALLPLRACRCTFCRKHGARTTADPAGSVRLRLGDGVSLYRFGSRGAQMIVCARCGCYVAAVTEARDGHLFATVNVNCLDDAAPFARDAAPVDYDGESPEARLDRRARSWTPAVLEEFRGHKP